MTTFGFNLNNDEKKKIAERMGLLDTDLLKSLVIKNYLLAQSDESPEEKYKRLRNEKLEGEIIYRNLFNEYFKAFHKPPSSRGEFALHEKSQSDSISNVMLASVIEHFDYIEKIKDTLEVRYFCKHCGNKFEIEESKMIDEMSRHVTAMHTSELIK